jgi:hypothetical protein
LEVKVAAGLGVVKLAKVDPTIEMLEPGRTPELV